MLRKPSDAAHPVQTRSDSSYHPLSSYNLDNKRSYQQQYGDMYFLRLTKIKPAVEAIAEAAWEGTVIGGEEAKKVDRVLDVKQGELCWVVGTVFMAMSLKPDILDDVSKDRWISAPVMPQKYFADTDDHEIMLEDDSGRIALAGSLLSELNLVTGCIIAVMGTEDTNGQFEAIDIKVPDLPPQPERWSLSKKANGKVKSKDEDEEMGGTPEGAGKKIAIVSGLSFSGDASYQMELDLLLEYLLGEALGPSGQTNLSEINRLVIAGNSISMAQADPPTEAKTKQKKYGYDASSYNAGPQALFDEFLSTLLPSMPVTLLPGAQDPANATYPQQPIHTVMFPAARAYGPEPGKKEAGWLDVVTNPWDGEIEGWRILGTGGQNIDDVFKYVESDDRLGMMEAMCRWRCIAPTAPDTLWSYPFQDDDPFVLKDCPHVYFAGNQPEFGTRVIEGPEGQVTRLISVPSFADKKELVVLDTETLEVNRVQIRA